ncbi:phosphoribosyltransferase [Flavobacterium davisii]|uniref:Phosphoribosyltransferase n=1 Tax=Flavobacterium davisii TaxID=2906077 RepID=A0ABW8PM75_9FLAO
MKSITYLIELDKIFEEKKWKEKENYEKVLEALSNFSDIIFEKDEEYDLFLELLREFHWISLNDYYNSCKKLLTEIINDLDSSNQNIYIFPIITKNQNSKIKSGYLVAYLIKSLIASIENIHTYRFEDVNNFVDIGKIKFKKNDVLLLVDDFIGSGETLEECIQDVKKANKNIGDKFKILTIAIKKDTYVKLSKKYNIYKKLEILKGISDYNTGDDINEKKLIMRNIENRIFSSIDDYSLGFKESESLITLLRTPDNTFPIFWNNYKKAINLKPPFPRSYEKI